MSRAHWSRSSPPCPSPPSPSTSGLLGSRQRATERPSQARAGLQGERCGMKPVCSVGWRSDAAWAGASVWRATKPGCGAGWSVYAAADAAADAEWDRASVRRAYGAGWCPYSRGLEGPQGHFLAAHGPSALAALSLVITPLVSTEHSQCIGARV